eukprot:TRINITY_DN2235_c0_g1_i2.p1 TRINITY_DN2235_c0_g1~~TRINITY_DN2235_c0_g1_i2.p1  ORF type:complete len:253 (-),score=-2.10 TRINITY_DN2235_c0_g1_i2:31-789(-)
MTTQLSTITLFQLLDVLFKELDKVVQKSNSYRIETFGDCFYAVSGLLSYDAHPAQTVISTAFSMRECLPRVRKATGIVNIQMKFGCHFGGVYCGLCGSHFTATSTHVNLGHQMKSKSIAGRIHVSADLYNSVGAGLFTFFPAPTQTYRHFGVMKSFWVEALGTNMSTCRPGQASLSVLPFCKRSPVIDLESVSTNLPVVPLSHGLACSGKDIFQSREMEVVMRPTFEPEAGLLLQQSQHKIATKSDLISSKS